MLVTWQVTRPGLAWHVYINFLSLLGFSYSRDRSHVDHVTGHMLITWQVTWPGLCIYKRCFLVWFPYSFFPFFLFSICSSSGMPAIASCHLMCGFLNRAVPLHIVTVFRNINNLSRIILYKGPYGKLLFYLFLPFSSVNMWLIPRRCGGNSTAISPLKTGKWLWY